ncbi:MAG: hypothetical protein U1E60_10540 [Reyranellaceae bacterium]
MLGGAYVGSRFRRALPQHHLDGNAKDIVRLGAGLIATILAVVLGLMINSANAALEMQRGELRRIAADLILLDRLLESYGPEARPIRVLLRQGLEQLTDRIWAVNTAHSMPDLGTSSVSAEVFRSLHALEAPRPAQQSVRTLAVGLAVDIARNRLMLFEAMATPMPLVIVAVITFWLSALFVSFSLFTPVNRIAQSALVVIALSAAAALFLFLQMRDPLAGFVHIPRDAMSKILLPLG